MSRGHRSGHYSSMDETLAMLALEASYFKEGAFRARAVLLTIPAYTGSGTGTLTGPAATSIGQADGVAVVSGDTIMIPEGIPGLVSSVDAGPWIIQQNGGATPPPGTPFILVRPTWWPQGGVIGGPGEINPPLSSTIVIGPEGAFWPGTEWRAFASKGQVIGTNDPIFYPGRVTQTITLACGSRSVSNVPIRIASGTSNPYNAFFTRSSYINASSTVMYQTSGVSAGYLGSGSAVMTIIGLLSTGLVSSPDISIGNLTIENW